MKTRDGWRQLWLLDVSFDVAMCLTIEARPREAADGAVRSFWNSGFGGVR